MLIDLLLADKRHYTYEGYAARQVKAVFEKMHMPYRIIYLADGGLSEYLSIVQTDPPDWALGFSMLTPHCKPLCDIIQIPYFYWLENSIASAFNVIESKFGKVGTHDPMIVEKLNRPNICFLPNGVETIKHITMDHQTFDLVLFADLIDLGFLQANWLKICSDSQLEGIKQAIAAKNPLEAGQHFFYVEQYLQAERTYQMITAIGHQVRLDVFGGHAGNNWLIRLPQNIHLHSQLPFSEYLNVLGTSKMILLDPSSPWYFQAIAAGCLPVTPDQQKIAYYLSHPQERERELNRLRSVLPQRTWEVQINKLLEYMYES